MAIYVDPLFRTEPRNAAAPFRVGHDDGPVWSHLFAEEPDCDELHAFAQRIGLPRSAFLGDHYAVTAPMRDRAIRAGALPLTIQEAVAVWGRYPRVPCGCEALRLRKATSCVRVDGWIHMRYGCVLVPATEAIPHSA